MISTSKEHEFSQFQGNETVERGGVRAFRLAKYPPEFSEAVHAGHSFRRFVPAQRITQEPMNAGRMNAFRSWDFGLHTKVSRVKAQKSQPPAMFFQSSLTRQYLGTPVSKFNPRPDKMNTQQSQSHINVHGEPVQSNSLSTSRHSTRNTAQLRPIDPSQTLQLPFHESQKAETPFMIPLGGSLVIVTHPYSPIYRAETQSPVSTMTHDEGRSESNPEKVGTLTDGWVKIVDLTKKEETERKNKGDTKKRRKKEGRNEDVAEPVKKKCRDEKRESWAKNTRDDKARVDWRQDVNEMRRGCV